MRRLASWRGVLWGCDANNNPCPGAAQLFDILKSTDTQAEVVAASGNGRHPGRYWLKVWGFKAGHYSVSVMVKGVAVESGSDIQVVVRPGRACSGLVEIVGRSAPALRVYQKAVMRVTLRDEYENTCAIPQAGKVVVRDASAPERREIKRLDVNRETRESVWELIPFEALRAYPSRSRYLPCSSRILSNIDCVSHRAHCILSP